MNQIQLEAYAKINLTLDVVGRCPDGYHLLRSVIQSISLSDTVTLTKTDSAIELDTDSPHIPVDKHNIAWQAARHFLRHTGITEGVHIYIAKRIPTAAGLGGGTADGAAVLVGLNHLYEAGLSLSELQKIGVKIGADVPFCLAGGIQLAEGIGEKLTPLPPLPDVFFALVKPKHAISTAKVYGSLQPESHGTTFTADFIRLLDDGASLSELGQSLGNVLESVTIPLIPEIAQWKRRFTASGAVGTLMSGSGPTIFGLFRQYDQAQKFADAWNGGVPWNDDVEVMVARPCERGVRQVIGGDR